MYFVFPIFIKILMLEKIILLIQNQFDKDLTNKKPEAEISGPLYSIYNLSIYKSIYLFIYLSTSQPSTS